MAQQTSEDHALLKNAGDRSSRIAGSYVRNVAVKLEEKMSESGSEKVLLHTRRSHNMRISFSLHGQSASDGGWPVTWRRNVDSAPRKCPRSVIGLPERTKSKTCVLTVTRSAAEGSDLMTVSPKALDAENVAPPVISLADIPKTASDVQPAIFGSSLAGSDHRSAPMLNVTVCNDVETSPANSSATSIRSGQ